MIRLTEIVQIFIIFPGYTTPKWFSDETKSIWVLEGLGSIHIPTKVQLSSVARRLDFQNDQNKRNFLKFSSFSRGIRPQSAYQVEPMSLECLGY